MLCKKMAAVKSVDSESSKRAAIDHFRRVDQKLYALARRHWPQISPPAPTLIEDRAAVLMKSIVGQQISIKAANSIWRRLQPVLFLNSRVASPDLAALKLAGASTAKAKSLQALGQALKDRRLDMAALDDLTDDQVIDRLTQYPGIGPWTAEMFLISGLGRPDVFSLRDLGLRTALARLHRRPAAVDQLEPIARKYSPHGTLAALVCWRSLDNGDLYAEV